MLPREALERERVSARVTLAFSAWGYAPVETPVVELDRVLAAAAGPLEGTAFRLIDVDGSLLALRPEMTVPVARLVAAHLDDADGPQRLRYRAEVFRERESLRGEARQFTQLGVELLGASGPAADAEVVAVLCDALAAAGLREFTVGIGTVAVLNALLDASDAPEEWREAVRRAAHDRNVVALDLLAKDARVAAGVGSAIASVVRVRGGREAIAECGTLLAQFGRADALRGLEQTWNLIEAVGTAGRVLVDFGILRQFDYYSGLVLEAYAPGLGLPLGGGGRYDAVLGAFGPARPAAGFALGLERLMIALVEQGVTAETARLDAVVGGEAAACFAAARRLRDAGWTVVVAPDVDGVGIAAQRTRVEARTALLARARAIEVLDDEGAVVGVLGDPSGGPPSGMPPGGDAS